MSTREIKTYLHKCDGFDCKVTVINNDSGPPKEWEPFTHTGLGSHGYGSRTEFYCVTCAQKYFPQWRSK